MEHSAQGLFSSSEFAGWHALVTGGSRGIGREVVLALAARGAHVVIASRKIEACRALAREVESRFEVEALPLALNVSHWVECDRVVDAAYDHFGRIDLLVNNAGLSPVYPSLDRVSQALFEKVVAVNLGGPFRLMATIGSRMAAGEGGGIVNIGSVEAIRPHEEALPYAAAKAGLHVLTEGFAQALAPKVRVNTVQLGAVLTDISQHWEPGRRADMERQIALQRCADPREVVGAVLFLASQHASYSTGALLRVDGGWR